MKKYSDKFKSIIGSSKEIINDVIDDGKSIIDDGKNKITGIFSKDETNDIPSRIIPLSMDSDNIAIINKINEIIDKLNLEE